MCEALNRALQQALSIVKSPDTMPHDEAKSPESTGTYHHGRLDLEFV